VKKPFGSGLIEPNRDLFGSVYGGLPTWIGSEKFMFGEERSKCFEFYYFFESDGDLKSS